MLGIRDFLRPVVSGCAGVAGSSFFTARDGLERLGSLSGGGSGVGSLLLEVEADWVLVRLVEEVALTLELDTWGLRLAEDGLQKNKINTINNNQTIQKE